MAQVCANWWPGAGWLWCVNLHVVSSSLSTSCRQQLRQVQGDVRGGRGLAGGGLLRAWQLAHGGLEGVLEGVHQAAAGRKRRVQEAREQGPNENQHAPCMVKRAQDAVALPAADLATEGCHENKAHAGDQATATYLKRPLLGLKAFLPDVPPGLAGATAAAAMASVQWLGPGAAAAASSGCAPRLSVAAVLLARGPLMGLLKTSMLTVCFSMARVGLQTVRVALKCEASLLMLMEVVEVEVDGTSLTPAGLPASAMAPGVRGDIGMSMGDTLRRGALGLVGREPWCRRVARGEQGTLPAGLQGGVSFSGCKLATAAMHCACSSMRLCASSRPRTDAL